MAETLKKSKASLTSLKSAARYIPGVKGSSSAAIKQEGKDHRESNKISILRIAASDQLTVTCTHTASLTIGVPFKRGFPSSSSSSSNTKDSRKSSFMDRIRGATVGVAITSESPSSSMKNKQPLISATTSHLPPSAINGIGASSTTWGVNASVRDSPTSINTNHSDAGGTSGKGSPGARIGTPLPPWTYLHENTSSTGTDDGSSSSHCHAIVDAIENNVVAGLSDEATCVQISITCGSRTQRDALALMLRSHPINTPY